MLIISRFGYSATADQLHFTSSAASLTPIMSENKSFNNSTHFRLYQQKGKGANVRTFSKASP